MPKTKKVIHEAAPISCCFVLQHAIKRKQSQTCRFSIHGREPRLQRAPRMSRNIREKRVVLQSRKVHESRILLFCKGTPRLGADTFACIFTQGNEKFITGCEYEQAITLIERKSAAPEGPLMIADQNTRTWRPPTPQHAHVPWSTNDYYFSGGLQVSGTGKQASKRVSERRERDPSVPLVLIYCVLDSCTRL